MKVEQCCRCEHYRVKKSTTANNYYCDRIKRRIHRIRWCDYAEPPEEYEEPIEVSEAPISAERYGEDWRDEVYGGDE